MKHYPHHIGDFDKATRHLTRIERSVYRDLIDLYYDTECRLTLDLSSLCRRIVARSNEESTAVQQVLNEFFTETPTGWYHDRCEHEIAAYHSNTSQKAMAGKASAEAKRLKKLHALNGTSTAVEHTSNSVETGGQQNSTNQSTSQPINQQPLVVAAEPQEAPRKRSATQGSRLAADWVLPMAWGQWAIQEIPGFNNDTVRLEAAKFADFWHAKVGKDATKADWFATWRNWCRNAKLPGPQAESFRERDTRLAAERVKAFTGGLCHDRKALGEEPRQPLPFERGYVAPVDIIEGEAHEQRRITG